MSDNPYERTNPGQPVEPVSADAATDSGGASTAPSDAPWSQRLDPAPPDDDAPWLVQDDGVRQATPPADGDTGPVPTVPADPGPDAERAVPAEDHGPAPAARDPHADGEDHGPAPAARDPHADGEHAVDDATGAEHRATADDEPATRDAEPTDTRGEPTTVLRAETGDAERTQVLRTHQAERPVPRSGLAEHRSAAYLTGERPAEPEPRPDQEHTATTPAPWLSGAGTGAGATAATAATAVGPAPAAPAVHRAEEERTRPERDVVLEGTTAHTRPPSRAKAHVLTILLTLLLTPVAWYLLADAGARLTLPQGNPWDTANLNVAALLELAAGLLVLVLVLLAARWSSVGAIVTGALVIIVGVPFVAVPAWTQDLLQPVESWLAGLGDFGDNIAHHLIASGSTGRLVAVGVALVLVGVVSHGARRQGRREVRPAVEA
ncbi:hypothetical protein M3148_16295 [Georgenia satyanarayanai]|uniref:hypothetical protein n=1 Tax=Georgenia satyanarayanai TaxID=860221 RepID=UPI002040485C|nr:hypothetical protein [Georgenia satyanarayanai]MCM3662539.1 hypothetical protein [Georgenia satyanarayanai]